jgi:tetratricopeptide (TPR) repeat protein
MNSKGLTLESADLQRFSRHARAGALMTLVGALIVIGSIVYASSRLNALEVTVRKQKSALLESNTALERVRRDRAAVQRQLDTLKANLRSARNSFYLTQLGVKRFYRRDFKGAVDLYDQAINGDPANPVLFDLKGYALLRDHRLADSVTTLENAIRIDPCVHLGSL